MDREALVQGLHRLPREERLARIQAFCNLSSDDMDVLSGENPIPATLAENFIENVVGFFPVPFGVATHFVIDGKEVLIPMVVEETSIIAAASASAKWVKQAGSIRTEALGRRIIGQVQLPRVSDPVRVRSILENHRLELIDRANDCVPGLLQRGGGVQDITVRTLDRADQTGTMIVLHVMCDPCDAMGANLINQVCEHLKPSIELLTGERVGLCILSNLVDSKLVRATAVLHNVEHDVGVGIAEASQFAKSDPYRATTHNKGVLNGIDPILIATGNDWRAVEAGIHAYASRSGRYEPVTEWNYLNGSLTGKFEAPLALGTVGGLTRCHPVARICLKMLGTEHAEDLARVCAAVGLVQNLGALRALSTVGIVRGHMHLHTSNLAIAAGATGQEIAEVKARLAEVLRSNHRITLTHAVEILENLRSELPNSLSNPEHSI